MRRWPSAKRDEHFRERQASICREEYDDQRFWGFNERPVEYAFVFSALSRYYPRDVLDVGSGTTALPALMRTCGFVVTATDNVRDYWPAGMTNRHYHVVDDDITDTRLSPDSYDLITCVSVLEHIQEPDTAVAGMLSLLRPGGHLVLSFPYTDAGYVRNVYDLPGSTYGQDFAYITQSFSRAELDRWFGPERAHIVDQQYWRFWSGDHWTVGERQTPPLQVEKAEKHQISCVLVRKSRDSEAVTCE